MPRSAAHRPPPRERDLEYWQAIIENRLPLVGAWFREVAANRLGQLARQGDCNAARSLAFALDENPDERVREVAGEALQAITSPDAWSEVWDVWVQLRGVNLDTLLQQRAIPGNGTARVRVYSLLRLGKESLLTRADGEQTQFIMAACEDQNSELAAAARELIGRLKSAEGLDVLAAAWSRERKDYLEHAICSSKHLPSDPFTRVLVLLKCNRPEEVLAGGAEIVTPLVQATRDQDKEIASLAGYCLRHLGQPAAIDEFCAVWAQKRTSLLEEILLQNGWVAERPLALRLLTALKTGKQELAAAAPPAGLEELLSFLADRDEAICSAARSALLNLTDPLSREAICQRLIEQDDAQAREIALQAGYLPASPDHLALFYFLTSQWEAYSNLDFDQRLMRSAYTAARPELRRRIARSVQAAGRVDFLRILAGVDLHTEVQALAADEIRLMITMLNAEQQWPRLWDLAQELPFVNTLEIMRLLAAAGWQPEEAEQELFQTLHIAAAALPQLNPSAIQNNLPPALATASVKVHGRVNCIAFSPTAPFLAVGTGQRKVVLWNYQRGTVEKILGPFEHSIGQIVFTPSGKLYFAERSNPDMACSIYEWDGEQVQPVGQLSRSITALAITGPDRLLSASSDNLLTLWDTITHTTVSQRAMPVWASRARDMTVVPGGEQVLLVHEKVQSVDLPDLSMSYELFRTYNKSRAIDKSVINCISSCPDGDLVIGQTNGQVIWIHQVPGKTYREKHLLHKHGKIVQGLACLPDRHLLLSAGGDGVVTLIPWPQRSPVTRLPVAETLSSMEVSPDGAFFATGVDESKLIFWDLRVRDLAALMEQPLALVHPDDLGLVRALMAVPSVTPPVKSLLTALQALLHQRFRFDIHIAEPVTMQAGEFDIILDEAP